MDALWQGRLGLGGPCRPERLAAYLTSRTRRPGRRREEVRDIFDDCAAFEQFYREWCEGQGLTDAAGDLTVDGRAVLALLALTRRWDLGPLPVGDRAVHLAADPAGDPGGRGRMFAEADAFGRDLPYRFERMEIAGRPVVTLSGRHSFSGLALGAVLWTQDFADEASRDAFHHWLCVRVDRWGDWGHWAANNFQRDFTAHLLSLIAVDMVDVARLG